jgi:DNA invertase Pin-like site-specific DNA recombinase
MTVHKKVCSYVRVSTVEQNTELQKRELEAYCKARGWNLIKVYEDKSTGTNANRPALKELMQDAREAKFGTLVIFKLDRLFRSLRHMVTTLNEFESLEIEFISLKDHIDLSNASGRLLMHLLAAFAEFECNLINERVKSGLNNCRAKGIKLGRPNEIDSYKVINLRRNGFSLSQISKQLGCSKTAVHKILSNHQVTNPITNLETPGDIDSAIIVP